MKTIFRANMLLLSLCFLLHSCKKDENKIYLQGGTAPVLSADQTELVLTHDNAAQTATTFSWSNPNYMFNTGVSSQNVNYLLQVDTTGSNFSSPQAVSISQNLSETFTQQDLNTVLTKLNLQENIPHNVEFRIQSTLVNNSAPLYSNVVKMVVTPYLDVAVPIPTTGVLYITGDGVPSSWTNTPPDNQLCTKVSNTEYTITMSFVPGKQYKFLSTQGAWQPQYGIAAGGTATGGNIAYNLGTGSDPASFATPGEAGNYKVDLNFKTGRYTVTKQ